MEMEPSRSRIAAVTAPVAGAGERRRQDRRRFSAYTLLYGAVCGRRRGNRRVQDRRLPFPERYESRLLYLTIGILLLCFMDAVLTLQLLDAGGHELNAFMALLIAWDIQIFAAVKMALTGGCVMVLVVLSQRALLRRLAVSHVIRFFFAGYTALVAYELVLLLGPVGWSF